MLQTERKRQRTNKRNSKLDGEEDLKMKVCNVCGKNLQIDNFFKNSKNKDGRFCRCKDCVARYRKEYRNTENGKIVTKNTNDKCKNTFKRTGHERGNSGMLKRDYELTEEQMEKRNRARKYKKYNSSSKNPYAVLIWYSGKLENLNNGEYKKELTKEYCRQRMCAIRGRKGRTNTYENFLFDFDLEKMLQDKIHYKSGNNMLYIEKWWPGTIRHWTVKDGIWRK